MLFGAQHAIGRHIVRTIGLARAKIKIGMMNLVYNMKLLLQLIKPDALTANPYGLKETLVFWSLFLGLPLNDLGSNANIIYKYNASH